MSFVQASAITAIDALHYIWDVPDGWQQGRGAFGGLVLGALVRAAEGSEPDRGRRARVITGELCAPARPGPTTITVRHLRRGNGVTYAEAWAVQGADTVARASVLLAADRKVDGPPVIRAAPALPPWSELPVIAPPSPPGPLFTRHLAYRPTGPLPFSSAAASIATGHVAMRVPLAVIDAAAICGLLDAWWPAVLATMTRPRPMATVSFTAELLVDPATVDPTEPFAYSARVDGGGGGYYVELRELWQRDRLIALNQQTFALLA